MNGDTRWGKRGRHDDPESAREHILQATYRALTTKGLEKTTISEIAKQAKVSRPTIYRYFDSRDAIIETLMIARRDRFFAEMRQATQAYTGDLRLLVVRCLIFGALYHTREDSRYDIVSGPNIQMIASFLNLGGTCELWRRILEEPYRHYRQQGGLHIELEDLIGFMSNMLLVTRNYAIPAQTLERQLLSFLALGSEVALQP